MTRASPRIEAPGTLLVAVVTGVLGGLVGAAYLAVLRGVAHVLGPDAWSAPAHLVVLVLVGSAIAAITHRLGEPGDVELLVDDIHVLGGAEDLRGLRSLVPVSLLGIGAGSTLGPEAPLVQTTGSLGTVLARRLGLGPDRARVVTISGMAAGFAVLFGAPLGSAFFALEILHRRGLEYYEAVIPALVGALSGYLVYVPLGGLGLTPVWSLGSVGPIGAGDVAVAVGATVIGAGLAHLFTWTVAGARRVVAGLPRWVAAVVGGLLLGVLGLVTPLVLTNGELQVEGLLAPSVPVGMVVVAVAGKFVASAALGPCGWRGGFIIPLFFVGFGVAELVHVLVPGTDVVILGAALVIGLNVGVTKTPVGTCLVVTEMAGMALLPTSVLAAVLALLLTPRAGPLQSQRGRVHAGVTPPGGR